MGILLFNHVFSIAQNPEVNFKKANDFLHISDSLYDAGDFSSMHFYDSMALINGRDIPALKAKALFQEGKYYLEMGNYKEAINTYKNALLLFYEKVHDVNTALIYNDLGYTEGQLGHNEEQINWYLKSIRIYELLNDDAGLAQVYSNIASAYFEDKNNVLAFTYAEQALSIRKKLGDTTTLSISYCNIANMYATINDLEHANNYLDSGMNYAAKSGDKVRLAQAYITKSLLLNRQKNNKEAFEYEKKAITIYEELGDLSMVASRSIAAAYYSNAFHDSIGAITYFNKAEKIAGSLNNKPLLRNVFAYLASFYKEHKNYLLAYDFQQKYYLYRDSIMNGETATKIAALQGAFDVEKKDFEINKLQVDQKIKSLEIEKQKNIIMGNLAEAQQKQIEIDLLYKNRLLQEETLKRKQNELDNQKLKATNNQQELKIAEQDKKLQEKQLSNQRLLRNLLISVLVLILLLGALFISRFRLKKKLEQQASMLYMRNTISENLHDDIGASLSNIGMLNQLARNNTDNESKLHDYLGKAAEDIQHVSESISDIVWNINPSYDNMGNLLIRMKRYAADMMDGKNIDYEINFTDQVDKISLEMDMRRNFYLLFKEAVNNLVKYSEATKVNMKLSFAGNFLELYIHDNGIGFDVNTATGGNGMTNMRNRAKALNGKLEIETLPGNGTTIHLNFPIT